MFTFLSGARHRDCEGTDRRDFLRVGTLGLGAFTLPQLLRIKAASAASGHKTVQDKSVIWIWLAGGPTHVETFDPKLTAPAEYRILFGIWLPDPETRLGSEDNPDGSVDLGWHKLGRD